MMIVESHPTICRDKEEFLERHIYMLVDTETLLELFFNVLVS